MIAVGRHPAREFDSKNLGEAAKLRQNLPVRPGYFWYGGLFKQDLATPELARDPLTMADLIRRISHGPR